MGAYNVGNVVSTQGQSMMEGAQAAAQAIRRWRETREADQKKEHVNEGVFTFLHGQTDTKGESYIPQEALERWDKMNPDQRAGALGLAVYNYQQDHSARAQRYAQQAIPYQLSDADRERAAGAHVVPLPTSPHSYQYVPEGGKGGAAALPEPGTAVTDTDGNEIGVWDAKGKISRNPVARANPLQEMQDSLKRQEIAGYDADILRMQGEMAKGNNKTGPDWNPLATSYADQIRELEIKKAQAQATMGRTAAPTMPAAAAAPPTPRPSPTPAAARPPAGRTYTAQELQALEWVKQNPADPRAAAIKQRLGLQ